MANVTSESPPDLLGATLPGATRSSTLTPSAKATAWACLVLSEDALRRDRFVQSAEAAGWLPHPCGSVGEALQIDKRLRTQLAIVDLGSQSAIHKSTFLKFAGQSASADRLLLVCDEPDDDSAQSELLARQAGAWLYLPSAPFDEGLDELLHSAQRTAEKVSGFMGAV